MTDKPCDGCDERAKLISEGRFTEAFQSGGQDFFKWLRDRVPPPNRDKEKQKT